MNGQLNIDDLLTTEMLKFKLLFCCEKILTYSFVEMAKNVYIVN